MSAGVVYGDVVLRLALESDVESIVKIVNVAVPLMRASGNYQWGYDYPQADHFHRDIKIGQLWVAEARSGVTIETETSSGVIGVGALTEDQGDDYKQIWDIDQKAVVPHRVCVNPEARGKGVAKAFMRHAEQLSRDRGYSSVRVDTNSENEAMHHIFKSLGYDFLGDLVLAGREGMTFHAFEKTL
jgi:GNAT superfamily N-acetyltransferase